MIINLITSRRLFSSRPKYFSIREIDNKWLGQRFDKLVMAKMDVSWSGAHKLVRSNKIFISKGGKTSKGGVLDENEFVLKDVAYKLKDGDILCIDDTLIE